ncbi:unnamed protein product [Plutella xylostella]|uniref:(diamondback moth) hypothetical protein n=1 Tax=Plutella xylostella TaxID=51655 RepID=A0A8S4G216_PLUXY|nr:unnamed protein product [Plutella xylostella]
MCFYLQNRSPPPSSIPSALLYAPPEPLELLCVFPERASRVFSAVSAAANRAGGDARFARSTGEALEASNKVIILIILRQLLCVFPERASRVFSAVSAAANRAGGDARFARSTREALEALRRDGDARLPHVVVVDARQPQALDAAQLARF